MNIIDSFTHTHLEIWLKKFKTFQSDKPNEQLQEEMEEWLSNLTELQFEYYMEEGWTTAFRDFLSGHIVSL